MNRSADFRLMFTVEESRCACRKPCCLLLASTVMSGFQQDVGLMVQIQNKTQTWKILLVGFYFVRTSMRAQELQGK